MHTIKYSLLSILFYFSQSVGAADLIISPVPMLSHAANQILEILQQNKSMLKKNPQIISSAVRHHLLPHVDVSGMSRSVLGRVAWTKATGAMKSEFSNAFTDLVVRTYANPLTEYTNETIKFLPSKTRSNARFTRVNSLIIRANGNNIPLSYSLVLKNGEWKIYDLTVSGVSLLQSFRSQFAEALQNTSLEELVKQLRSKGRVALLKQRD